MESKIPTDNLQPYQHKREDFYDDFGKPIVHKVKKQGIQVFSVACFVGYDMVLFFLAERFFGQNGFSTGRNFPQLSSSLYTY